MYHLSLLELSLRNSSALRLKLDDHSDLKSTVWLLVEFLLELSSTLAYALATDRKNK